jgi:hypothetical protein
MTTPIEKRPVIRKYEDLPARPIMVYPKTAEQRDRFQAAAEAQGKGLSPYIVEVVEQHLKDEERMQELRDRQLLEKIRRQDRQAAKEAEAETPILNESSEEQAAAV